MARGKKTSKALIKIARPLIPAPVQAVTEAIWFFRQKRISAWWEEFVGRRAIDPHDVEDEILAAVADDNERTVQAIKDGVRAAADSVDPVVLPAMAMIARNYSRGDVPPWFQRNATNLLASLSAQDFGVLRKFVWMMSTHAATARGVLKVSTTGAPNVPTTECVAHIDGALQVFVGLKRHDLAHEQGHRWSPHPAVIVIDPAVIGWFQQVIPQLRA